MKRLLLLAFALQFATAFAQWEQMNGPYGGSGITCIINDTSTGIFYAGGYYSGVFKSDDGGESWVDISNGLTELAIRSLVIAPNGNLYTTGWFGVARLQAGNDAWEMLENELSALPVGDMAVTSENTLFAAVFNMDGFEESGVYRSMDNGTSWQFMLDMDNSQDKVSLTVNANDQVYFGATDDAFRSDDNGVTWINISPLGSSYGLYYVTSIAFGSGGTLFAGTELLGGIFRSFDNGATWELVYSEPLFDMASTSDIEINENYEIFASNFSGLIKSEDNGNTWNNIDSGPYANDLLAVGQDTLFAAAYNVYRSIDNGISFSEKSEGMIATSVNSVAVGADARIYATTPYKFWVMDYDEEIWEDISYNFPVLNGFKDVRSYPQGLFVIADGALYMSVDNGTTWQVASMLGEAIPADSYGVNNLGYIYIASDAFSGSGVYRSTDGGSTYELLDLELDNDTKMEINQNSTILIYEHFRGLHRSTDNGDTWEFIDFYNTMLSMETGDSGVFYATGYAGVWRTEDDGLSWQEITPAVGGENVEYHAIHKHPNDNLYLSSQEAVYISTNDGLTWNDYYTASAVPVGFISFASDPSLCCLFAGHSGRGLWKISTITGTEVAEADATNQLFPNPATHSITLQFDNYSKTTAPILIYNSSGHLVKQLPATSAQIEIDISSFSKGIYYVVYNGEGQKLLKH